MTAPSDFLNERIEENWDEPAKPCEECQGIGILIEDKYAPVCPNCQGTGVV